MNRKKEIIKSIKNQIVERKMHSIQALIRSVKIGDEYKLAIKFASIDNDRLRAKLNNLIKDYCEDLELYSESKTTRIYLL